MVCLLAALAVGPSALTPALALGANLSIKVRVESILATNSHPSTEKDAGKQQRPFRVQMDQRLKDINLAERLTLMFSYSSYHLLRHQQEDTSLGGAVAFNLPGGHILHVCPLGFRNNALLILLQMFEGERMIMRMPMRIVDDGVLMLVDERKDNEYYITAISADTPPFDGPAKVQIDPDQTPLMPVFPLLIPAY